MNQVYLVGAVRTPIGRFGGTLGSWTAADLGVAVAQECLRRAAVNPEHVQGSIWGCARQAVGPNIGRQISYRAGVPDTRSVCQYLDQQRPVWHIPKLILE